MGRFVRKSMGGSLRFMCRPLLDNNRVWILVVLLTVFGLLKPNDVIGEDSVALAVLPFRVHAQKMPEELKHGLQETLTVQMQKKGFHVISPEVINKHTLVFLPAFDTRELVKIGKDLNANWIITGSLTQIGERISIDLKVVDITGAKPPFSLYMVAENIDALKEISERIAVSIGNQITGVVQVDSIQVKGNQRIEKEAILGVLKTKKGDRFDYGQLDGDLREIYKMGFFKDVKIELEDGATGKIVIFSVTEKPSIGKIVFEGNEKVKSKKLRKELGIELYSILDHNKIRQSINNLKDYYRKKAYYNVEIVDEIEPLPNNEILVKYQIAENEKVFITKIQFTGNTKFKDKKLKKIMETSEKGFFSWITKSGHLDQKKLDFDVHKISSFYHNDGYIKAKASDPKITYEKGTGLTVTIDILEGHQYGVNEVVIDGDLIKPVDELMESIQIRYEEAFNREVVRRDILALKDIYADEGYAYARVTPRTKEDNENYLVDISYTISKGEKVRFERINISGNTKTRDKVIRRELKAVEGEYFSGKALKKSTQNLYRLGFFEDIEVQTKKGSRDDLMILDIKVKERPTGSFSIGAGYSSVDNAFVMFKLAQDNLFGHGQRLEASAKLGGSSNAFDIRFIEPWLFDMPISADIGAYKTKQEYDEYTTSNWGGGITFGFPVNVIDEYTRFFAGYNYDNADITDILPTAAASIREMEGINVTSSMKYTIRRDSRDRRWNTQRGSVNSFSFEYAGGFLGGDVGFNRYKVKSAWYFPLFWDTVFMAQGRGGYVGKRPGGKLPVYQKFRLGGINSVRGFNYASISPKDPVTGDRIGGEKMMVYNFEYRFPLLKDQGLMGVAFIDAGNVFSHNEDYTFNGIRRTAGAGVRWYSPLGPLRLEYGWNLDKQEDEIEGRWEFSIGGSF